MPIVESIIENMASTWNSWKLLLIDGCCGRSCPLTRWPKNPALCDATYVCLGMERRIEGSTVQFWLLHRIFCRPQTEKRVHACMDMYRLMFSDHITQSRRFFSHECKYALQSLESFLIICFNPWGKLDSWFWKDLPKSNTRGPKEKRNTTRSKKGSKRIQEGHQSHELRSS